MEQLRLRKVLLIAFVFLLLPFDPEMARADDLPESAYISGFTGRPQTYTLSCESRSAVDWAAFWGISISESEFLTGLPKSDNPDVGFVGDPNGPWGNIPPYAYGVHAKPVAALLTRYGLQASAKRGLMWNDLRAEIAAGRPVIVWIIGAMWPGAPVTYTASNGKQTIVAPYEHTMVLIGYDAARVHVVDAYSGWNQAYPLETFLASWGALGNMAVLGHGQAKPAPTPKRPHKKTPTPAAPEARGKYTVLLPVVSIRGSLPAAKKTPARKTSSAPREDLPKTYTVQRGDYLIDLAEHYGLDWRDLAALNGIQYPFVIYPGQVLIFR